MDRYVFLEERGLVTIAGEDRVAFLQGLISNDAAKVSPGHTLYAAFLTAQGKFLHDFFVIDMGEMLALDWAALADPHSTTAFYMGRGAAGEISRQLIAAGLDGATPVLRSREWLNDWKNRMGAANFAAQMRNRPISGLEQCFDPAWLKYYDEEPEERAKLSP